MLMGFIANHDTDRAAGFLTVASGQAKVAANLLLLAPGSPFIYYGEEIGLKGSRGGATTDANRRLAMNWGDADTVTDPEGANYSSGQTNGTVVEQLANPDSLLHHYRQLILVRKAHPEIAYGQYQALKVPDSKVGGFLSTWNGSTVAVFHNTTNRTITVDLSAVTDVDLTELTAVRGDYDRIREALDAARTTGYGVVLPDRAEMTMQKPELLKKGGSCGVSLKCSAPSIHMLRVDLQTELSPMVGGEEQARDLLEQLEGDREEVLDKNLFGKTVWELASDGLGTRLSRTDPQTLEKFRQSLTRILSEGAQGLICIIL
jgi:hypothetical protein